MIMIGIWALLILGIVGVFLVERRRRRQFIRRAEAGDVRPEEYGASEHDVSRMGAENILREGFR